MFLLFFFLFILLSHPPLVLLLLSLSFTFIFTFLFFDSNKHDWLSSSFLSTLLGNEVWSGLSTIKLDTPGELLSRCVDLPVELCSQLTLWNLLPLTINQRSQYLMRKKTSLSSRSLRDRFSGKSDKITGKIVYSHYYFIRVTLLSLLLRVITKSPTKLQQ